MMNGQIGDLVFLSQCTRSVVASGLLGNSTFVCDELSFRVSALGGISLTRVALVTLLLCLPACTVCGQHLQPGSLSEHGRGATGGGVAGGNQIMNGSE